MSRMLHVPNGTGLGRVNFNAMYAMKVTQVDSLLEYLSDSTFLDDVALLFNSPSENLVSLRVYPFNVVDHLEGEVVNDEVIEINNVTTTVYGYPIEYKPLNIIEVATFEFTGANNSFLDYEPYTSIELYLPYIGFVRLDPHLVMNTTTYVEYVVDLASGKCTAFISVLGETESTIIMTCDGTIGHEIQIGGGQGAEIARNMLKLGIGATAGTISTIAGAVATGGATTAISAGAAAGAVSGGVSLLASTAVNAITAGQVHVNKGGVTQPTISAYAPQEPYAIVTRPNVVEPTSYARDYGKPCGATHTLNNLIGFTVVDSIHVEGLDTATSDEITEVERLLKQGVIL